MQPERDADFYSSLVLKCCMQQAGDNASQVWPGQSIPVGRYGVYCLRVSKVRCEDVNKL